MPSTPTLRGSEFQVNTETHLGQEDPSVTALSDGGYIVTWMSNVQDGSTFGIFGQRYDANGTKSGVEFQINTETNSYQEHPSITTLTGGGFVVTWDSNGQDGAFTGIFGQRFNADGTTAGDEFQVNSETDSLQEDPTNAALSDGGFVVTWKSFGQDGDQWGIYAQRFNASGETVDDEFKVNTGTEKSQQLPSITGLSDGGFVITWSSYDDTGTGLTLNIYGQRYGSDGTVTGSEFSVHTLTDSYQSYPSIAELSDGGFVLTYSSSDQDGDGNGIFGQRYGSDGTPVGSEFQVNTTTTGDQSTPSVSTLPDGWFVVTWNSRDQDGSDDGIYGQVFNASGSKIGDEFQVNTETADDQSSPSIVVLSDGGFVVTWQSLNQDGFGWGVFGQQFNAPSTEAPEDLILLGGKGNDILNGGDGNDILKGKKGNDVLNGGYGNDLLKGGKGKDTLSGDEGDDVLKGGKGKDILDGGAGDDSLYGGKGADVFVFDAGDGSDTIYAFKNGTDKLDFSGFGFANKAEAKSHFFEKGSAKNDVVGFEYDGTEIRIEGLDLRDINGADFII